MLAGVVVAAIGWCALGLAIGFPQGWFLSSNIGGTTLTLVLLLLKQHSQNRDMHALQAKVDELIRSSEVAGNHWIGAEQREVREIEQMVQARHPSTDAISDPRPSPRQLL